MKVLVVEDDPATVDTVSLAFELRWPDSRVVSTSSGGDAAILVEKEAPDVVILDLGLPDMDGLHVLSAIRSFSNVPTIILTARDDRTSKVRGLELGADDYVTKPFDPIELISRTKAILRRGLMPELAGDEGVIRMKDATIDLASRRLTVNGVPVSLTATEWKLLSYLARSEGKVVSQQVLADRLWGDGRPGDPATTRRYISRLRKKLGEDPQSPHLILTEHSAGYRFIRLL